MTDTGMMTIHSRKMAIYLQCRGFVLHGVQPNLKNKFNVFIFSDTERIRKAMSDYKNDGEFHSYLDTLEGR